VFADLDETVRQLLIRNVPLDPSEVEVSFEAPDREWSGRLTRPAVNCFLYDVRENVKLRMGTWEVRRDGNNLATKQRGPIRVDVTYQVTAWARAPEDEHRLLWRVMSALARHTSLPADILQGLLKEQPLPIPTAVAQPDQMPSNFADLWQALDNRIRPAVTYVVTLALDPEFVVTTPLTLKSPAINLNNLNRRDVEVALSVRGRVRDRQDPGKSLSGALVLLEETGDRTMTDGEGQFSFANVPRGPITLVVRAEGRPEHVWPTVVPSTSYDVEV